MMRAIMTTLRVTTQDDRSPLVVHKTGLNVGEQVALAGAAHRCGLIAGGHVGFVAVHPQRVVDLFVDLGWDPAFDAGSDRAVADAWAAAEALMHEHLGATWRPPGDALVRGVGCVPYAFQETGSTRLATSPGGLILADAPGLGKTLQVLLALPPGAAVNVACPRNAVPTWEDEVARWRKDLTVRSLKKRGSARPARPGDVVVGTLESLPAFDYAWAADVVPGSYLICDEAHSLKGESAQAARFKSWARVVQNTRGWTWLLSGTPVLNADPEELWRLLDACGRAYDTLGPASGLRGLFGHTVDTMWIPRRKRGTGQRVRSVVDGPVDLCSVTAESAAAAHAETHEQVERVTWTGQHLAWVDDALSRAIVRRTKEAVFEDMPAITRQDVRVHVPASVLRELAKIDVGKRLTAELDALERALGADAREDELDRLAVQPAVATARKLLAAAKVEAVMLALDDLEAAGEPALVFSAHVTPALEVGARPGWAVISGDVTGERRGKIRADFQAGRWSAQHNGGSVAGGDARGVSMTIRAASESLTLTRAATVLFVDRDWVPARNEQAEARAHRIGQTRPVMVLRFVADHPIDRRVASIIAAKEAFGGRLLAGIENR